MSKITVDVVELTDPNPTRVSLVKHAANRTPFRIFKENDEMGIDLGGNWINGLRNALTRKAETPKIAAVVVLKGFDISKTQPEMEKHGFVFTEKHEQDGYDVYNQPGRADTAPVTILKYDDNMALMIQGIGDLRQQVPVKKDFKAWDVEACGFMDALNTNGFYPSMSISLEALQTAAFNCVSSANSPEEAAGMVTKAIDDFKAWMIPCITSIPTQAFKAEVDYMKVHQSNPGVRNAAAVLPLGLDDTASMMDRQLLADEAARVVASSVNLVAKSEIVDFKGTPHIQMTYGDGSTKIFELTGKAESPIGTQVSPEVSKVIADQGVARIGGQGGKNPQVVGNAAEAPIGVQVTDEPAPAEDTQRLNDADDTGHGGKLPNVGGTGSASIGVQVNPEPSPVRAAQAMKEALSEIVGPLTEMLTKVSKTVEGLGTRLDSIDSRVQKAESEIGGMVLGTDRDVLEFSGRKPAQKSEGAPPLLDTAYDRSHLRDPAVVRATRVA